MIDLGLSDAGKRALATAAASSHRIRIGIELLDGDERVVKSLHVPVSRMREGAVEYDANADITRSLRMDLVDKRSELAFDPTSPGRSALYADNFVAVTYGILVPSVGWVDVPVFWGPLTHYHRSGGDVTIEAQGKEALALDPHFAHQGYTLRKGRRVDDAIRDVMDRLGERRYRLARMAKRLPRARVVEDEDEPWDVVKFGWEAEQRRQRHKGKRRRRGRVSVEYNGLISLAGPFTIFYNGRGELTARQRTRNPVFAFLESVHLESSPAIDFDSLTARNHVVVTGAKVPVGKKPDPGQEDKRRQVQMRGHATLKPSHPLSPRFLARHGVPRLMTDYVTVENLKTHKACRERAQHILHSRSQDGLEVGFTALPIPMLEERDTVRIITDEYVLDFPLQRWSLPLTGELMTVGWVR